RAALASKAQVRIRVPLMPNLNDSAENIRAMANFLEPFRVHEVEVMPYHAFGKSKISALHREQPSIQAYTAEQLSHVLARFTDCGLKAVIV
ncbi:MAG: glycyl-radical enzyme activating protein, partial [Desulfovibrionaceae bacterium]